MPSWVSAGIATSQGSIHFFMRPLPIMSQGCTSTGMRLLGAVDQELHQRLVVEVALADVVADLHADAAGVHRAAGLAAGQVQRPAAAPGPAPSAASARRRSSRARVRSCAPPSRRRVRPARRSRTSPAWRTPPAPPRPARRVRPRAPQGPTARPSPGGNGSSPSMMWPRCAAGLDRQPGRARGMSTAKASSRAMRGKQWACMSIIGRPRRAGPMPPARHARPGGRGPGAPCRSAGSVRSASLES